MAPGPRGPGGHHRRRLVRADDRRPAVAVTTPAAHREVASPGAAALAAEAARALVQTFRERAGREPGATAIRYKRHGIWRALSWGEYRDEVATTAVGLRSLGLAAGDRVALMAGQSLDWFVAEVAAQSLRAVVQGLYQGASPGELAGQLAASEPAVFLAHGQEQVDALLEAEAEAEAGRALADHVVVADVQGVLRYEDRRITSLEDVRSQGRAALGEDPGAWDRLVEATGPDDVVRLASTSGTGGTSRGALLTSRNLVASWGAAFSAMPAPPGPKDVAVVQRPLAYVGEAASSLVLSIVFGVVAHLPEDEELAAEALVEVSPTVLVDFPRTFEVQASRALIDLETGSRLKRSAYRAATSLARRAVEPTWRGERPSALARAGRWFAHQLVLRQLLNTFGYRRLRIALTGGAPVSPDVVRLWQVWGVPLRELYGLTEHGGVAALQVAAAPEPGGGLEPVPGTELRLAGDAEILLRGPGVFRGYWQDEQATARAVDAEGWLHTGDVGRQGAAGIEVVDRRTNLLAVAGAEQVPASVVEHALTFGPYVRDAMVVAHGRPHVGALVEIDYDNVADWARREHVLYTSFTSLATNPRVSELVGRVVEEANLRLAEAGLPPVRVFRLLPRELDEEVAPTHALRRDRVEAAFGELIDDMFRNPTDMAGGPGTVGTGRRDAPAQEGGRAT
ncbi:MAG: AMP-binding protein [Acidimicrobiia bacterium]|nr:AMP-binding protein [Acidimicrobiia bacterium]